MERERARERERERDGERKIESCRDRKRDIENLILKNKHTRHYEINLSQFAKWGWVK